MTKIIAKVGHPEREAGYPVAPHAELPASRRLYVYPFDAVAVMAVATSDPSGFVSICRIV